MSIANWDAGLGLDRSGKRAGAIPKGWFLLGAALLSCGLWASILLLAF